MFLVPLPVIGDGDSKYEVAVIYGEGRIKMIKNKRLSKRKDEDVSVKL